MRYVLLGLVSAALIGATAPAGAGPEYIFVTANADKAVYIDRASIKTADNRAWAWFFLLNAKPEELGSHLVDHSTEQVRFDCAQRTLLVTYGVHYDGSGKVQTIAPSKAVSSMASPVAPDTLGESMFESACGGAARSSQTVLRSTGEVLEIARALLKLEPAIENMKTH